MGVFGWILLFKQFSRGIFSFCLLVRWFASLVESQENRWAFWDHFIKIHARQDGPHDLSTREGMERMKPYEQVSAGQEQPFLFRRFFKFAGSSSLLCVPRSARITAEVAQPSILPVCSSSQAALPPNEKLRECNRFRAVAFVGEIVNQFK